MLPELAVCRRGCIFPDSGLLSATTGAVVRGSVPSELHFFLARWPWNFHSENCRLLERNAAVCHESKRADTMVVQLALADPAGAH